LSDKTPLPVSSRRECCLHKTTQPSRLELSRTRASPSFSCDPSAASFLFRQREPGVAEGKHSHHRTPWALSGTSPGPARLFLLRFHTCCVPLLPFYSLARIPSIPPGHHHHFTLTFPPLHLSGRLFSSYFLHFSPLQTRHWQRLETSIRSLHTGFLPDLGAEAALMGTYHPSPWGSRLPTAFLLPWWSGTQDTHFTCCPF